ncbi:hypothetical protein NDU88_005620 [Pleurodeles waltl]|uniref:Uncharacterized protein n=1 Tax=Pleurodeles waltl TaxID=8319 RepID=A0AAV7VJK7_PLEWA|nr:hypothetical protein NDU88_005620 [Pleurodeles waltl]
MGGSTTIKESDTGPIRDAAELIGDGDSSGPGCLATSDSGGLLQASVSCVGGNGLAVAFEGEIDQPLYAPGSQSNVGPAQEVVTGAGYCEQVAAIAYLLPSTDPPTLACALEVICDRRQGREDSLVQGEVGENFFSLSDQSQDSDEDSTSPSIDSETCDSSTAPLTPTSVLRGTAVKRQSKQTEVFRLDKVGESSEKKGKKKKASRTRAMSWDYTETQQLLHSMGDLSVAPAKTEINALNAEIAPPSPSLHLIYQTITSQHKQTQRDSKKARVATKQLQVAISKVAKTCSEIGERIAAIECWADVLESDLGAVTKQAAMHETQLSDIQWKVEDFENRQRRNNLRLIGIQEARGRKCFHRVLRSSFDLAGLFRQPAGCEEAEGRSISAPIKLSYLWLAACMRVKSATGQFHYLRVTASPRFDSAVLESAPERFDRLSSNVPHTLVGLGCNLATTGGFPKGVIRQ